MWECLLCGCQAIAGSLLRCPQCHKEPEMPKATTGGASNANALPGETGYTEPGVPISVTVEVVEPPEPAPLPEPVPAPPAPAPEPVPEPPRAPVSASGGVSAGPISLKAEAAPGKAKS